MTVHRGISRCLQESVAARRVTVVTGPRQAGKTTLAGLLLRDLGRGELRSLDDAGFLEAARSDPIGFVTSGDRPLVHDEIQRAGEPLVRTVKSVVDRTTEPGQFVLTGSSNFLTVPTISESLTGRQQTAWFRITSAPLSNETSWNWPAFERSTRCASSFDPSPEVRDRRRDWRN